LILLRINYINLKLGLSKGDLSLHVGIDNKRAIKIYEKMGFRKKYFRMMYQELES